MKVAITEPRRLLVVDDNPDIHRAFLSILADPAPPDVSTELEARLFGTAEVRSTMTYGLAHAHQGAEAVDMVESALGDGESYAVAFVDIRMPPGIDGIETTKRLLATDPSLQVVLCSAYSDYSWQDIADVLGSSDRVLVLKKPFDPLEVRQLASALTEKARLVHAQAGHVAGLDRLVRERTAELELANERLREESREREEAQRLLAQAQRLQSLGELTAGMAHEINNPLACIQANLDYVQMSLDGDVPATERLLVQVGVAIVEAIESGDRIARIVRDVRLFAAGHEGRLEIAHVRPVVESTVGRLMKTTKHIRVIQRIDDVPPVVGVAHRLTQILVNLLSNAALAFPVGVARDAEICVSVTHDDDPGEVVIEVRDNGEGIREEDLPRVLDPFFTTRGIGEGMGLGLAVSRGIVTSFGGRLVIESRRGEGTTVRVILPVSRQ